MRKTCVFRLRISLFYPLFWKISKIVDIEATFKMIVSFSLPAHPCIRTIITNIPDPPHAGKQKIDAIDFFLCYRNFQYRALPGPAPRRGGRKGSHGSFLSSRVIRVTPSRNRQWLRVMNIRFGKYLRSIWLRICTKLVKKH